MRDPDVSATIRHLQPTHKSQTGVGGKSNSNRKGLSPPRVRVIVSPDAKVSRAADTEIDFHGKTIHGKEPGDDLSAAID